MASFEDDGDPNGGSENESEDEEMEDVNEVDADADAEADQDQDMDQDQDDENEDDNDYNDNDNDDDEDQDQEEESPTRRQSRISERGSDQRSSSSNRPPNPAVVLTSPSPRHSVARSPSATTSFIPPVRAEALVAQAYDIVPTMAAPQSTSINTVTATPDMRWVFSGGSDGYVRMFNWVETANGKVPLTVAQKHPFVDSVWKAGSLLTYWENEETSLRTPPAQSDETKWTSPVYSLAVQHEALWLLSGTESGGINMQTCRHQAGTRITTLREHTNAVSVLQLSQDETSVLSGSWDKTIHDWDLNTGKVKRSFRGSGAQISAIEVRPMSSIPVPEIEEPLPQLTNGTFFSNNGDKPLTNGVLPNGVSRRDSKPMENGEEDAAGSPSGSLFGEGDHGSLFGEDNDAPGGGGNTFGDDDDDFSRAMAHELQRDEEQDAPGEQDTEMVGVGSGGPVQPPEKSEPQDALTDPQNGQTNGVAGLQNDGDGGNLTNGNAHSNEAPRSTSLANGIHDAASLPTQSESTFLDAAIDGTIRIWDRRVSTAIATIMPSAGTPPFCMGACWSPDGNFIYAGRRNCTVDEYSMHNLGSRRSEPNRIFKFQQGSGPVSAVRAMPNGKHLVW